MRAGAAILLVTFAMSLWDGAANPSVQTNLKRLGGPKPREIAGRPGTVCTEVSSDIHVCKAKAQNGQSSDLFFLVGGDVVARWPGRLAMFADQIHDVFLADLDADSRDELVIVDRLAVSNGIAATWDELFIMSAYGSPDRTVVRFRVQEYGRNGTVVQRPGRGGWWIFATEWTWSSILDPKRGDGAYVLGRWFRYAGGRLVSEPGTLARRYLSSFARERASDVSGAPYAWFVDKKGRLPAIDPALGNGRVVRSSEGRVDRIESPADAPPEDAVYRVRLDTGDEAQVLLGYTGRVENPPRVAIDHFGLASNGRVLPQGVTPDAVVGDISGHRVRLSEYKDGERLRRVLWIE
jgi:hypothetical protein